MAETEPMTRGAPACDSRHRSPRDGLLTSGLWLATAVCAPLLFFGGPGDHAPRSLQAAWNLGHVLLFWAGTSAVLRATGAGAGRRSLESPLRIFAGALILAAATEVIQGFVGRDPDVWDAVRDLLGSAGALLAVHPPRSRHTAAWHAAAALLGVALLLEAVPLARALADEAAARSRFPILADLETPFEDGRWEGSARRAIDRRGPRRGIGALRVTYGTERYSGAFLTRFPRDWARYRSFRMSVYLPGSAPLRVVLRAHDLAHEKTGSLYEDRFNRSLTLAPGWNDLFVPLEDLRRAPRSRPMDLQHMASIGLFTVSLTAPVTVYLDDVRLSP